MQNALDERRRRAAYRATHRGTKEMDWLLGRYAEQHLAAMTEMDLDVFERLIMLPDPDLQEQIMLGGSQAAEAGSEAGSNEFTLLIERIRAYHGIGKAKS